MHREAQEKGRLRRWLWGMKEHGTIVLMYIKVSNYADHKYMPLDMIFTKDLNLEYWGLTGIADERLKWIFLQKQQEGNSPLMGELKLYGSLRCQAVLVKISAWRITIQYIERSTRKF